MTMLLTPAQIKSESFKSRRNCCCCCFFGGVGGGGVVWKFSCITFHSLILMPTRSGTLQNKSVVSSGPGLQAVQ